jgi:hypothetical protein
VRCVAYIGMDERPEGKEMTHSAEEPASYHALLIGIDDYAKRPLNGCVNDIDAVQKILIERARVPKDRILRLASPKPGATCSTEIPAQPATLANLRGAFATLAKRANEGDRVFIYYSGHGARVEFARPDKRTFHREALVPVDYDHAPAALLYDHELNRLLGDIAARTRSVTFVLDCCHSAGATRAGELTPRFLDARGDLGLTAPIPSAETGATSSGSIARPVDDCHVVSACLNHELAREGLGADGRTHGLLTRAFVRSLETVSDAELPEVPWSRIWQTMRGDVEDENPQQHLWMAGNARRAVLGGQPVDGDPGFPVRRDGDRYELGAGTLASVTEAALVAVYGEKPAHFPPIDSAEDKAARLGVMRVTSAQKSSATATAEGQPFEIPPGARGRIIAPGKAARLRCAIVPAEPVVAKAVAESPLLELVEPGHAQARLEQAGDRWILTDDVHGTDPGCELCVLTSAQLDRARDVLDHYFSYALPLRLAESAIDLPCALKLWVLSCPEALSPDAAETTDLAEAPTKAGSSTYDVTEGAGICFRVQNTSSEQLRVTLVNAATSGKVQILDEQSIDAGSTHTFWAENTIGAPFEMTLPKGRRQGIDRLIAIGTTAIKNVRYLGIDRGFADVLAVKREVGAKTQKPTPVERWTATQVIIKTRAR